MKTPLDIEEDHREAISSFADLWFKILSWSVIIGLLKYASNNVEGTEIKLISRAIEYDINLPDIIYGISSGLLFMYLIQKIGDICGMLGFSKLSLAISFTIGMLILFPIAYFSAAMVSEIVSNIEAGTFKKPE